MLSLEPTEGAAVVGGSGDAGDQESGTMGDEADVSSSQRSIPIVDTETPGKVAISMRAAGVTVVTYLSRGEGKSHVQGQGQGQGQGEAEGEAQQGTSMQDQDLVVTLSETSAREIEACSEIDTVRGKVRKIGSFCEWFGRDKTSCPAVSRPASQWSIQAHVHTPSLAEQCTANCCTVSGHTINL